MTIYEIYLINNKKLPFTVIRDTWGNLSITVDKIENIKKGKHGYVSIDAFTLSEEYSLFDTDKSTLPYKKISCAHLNQWRQPMTKEETKLHNELSYWKNKRHLTMKILQAQDKNVKEIEKQLNLNFKKSKL